MPSRAKRICARPNCNELCAATYCDTHMIEAEAKRQRLLNMRRGNASDRGYDSRWNKLRLYKLSAAPLCERCLESGKVERAVLVHHIKPICDGGGVLEYDNLMSVCRKCHDDIHKDMSAKP